MKKPHQNFLINFKHAKHASTLKTLLTFLSSQTQEQLGKTTTLGLGLRKIDFEICWVSRSELHTLSQSTHDRIHGYILRSKGSAHEQNVHTHILNLHTHTYVHTYTHTYAHTYIQTHMLIHIHTYDHTNTHIFSYLHTQTHMLVLTHTHICSYLHTLMLILTHIHKPKALPNDTQSYTTHRQTHKHTQRYHE